MADGFYSIEKIGVFPWMSRGSHPVCGKPYLADVPDCGGGDVDLSGDAATAQRFQKLLDLAQPDIEEELSRVIGDVAAHRIAEIARGVGKWARDARATMGGNIREYLQEESREVPTRYEVERFTQQVGTLRDDVERIAARLKRLESNS